MDPTGSALRGPGGDGGAGGAASGGGLWAVGSISVGAVNASLESNHAVGGQGNVGGNGRGNWEPHSENNWGEFFDAGGGAGGNGGGASGGGIYLSDGTNVNFLRGRCPQTGQREEQEAAAAPACAVLIRPPALVATGVAVAPVAMVVTPMVAEYMSARVKRHPARRQHLGQHGHWRQRQRRRERGQRRSWRRGAPRRRRHGRLRWCHRMGVGWRCRYSLRRAQGGSAMGGGCYVSSSHLQLANCTVDDNTARGGSGGNGGNGGARRCWRARLGCLLY